MRTNLAQNNRFQSKHGVEGHENDDLCTEFREIVTKKLELSTGMVSVRDA
jgi:hypothetical protein